MKQDISLEFQFDYLIEKVWFALTDSKTLGEWLMENDLKPIIGHKFQFRSQPMPGWNGIVDCEVLEVDEPSRLSYTWVSGSEQQKHHTVVTWTLVKVSKGNTKLLLDHTGFEGEEGLMTAAMLEKGWESMKHDRFAKVLAEL